MIIYQYRILKSKRTSLLTGNLDIMRICRIKLLEDSCAKIIAHS